MLATFALGLAYATAAGAMSSRIDTVYLPVPRSEGQRVALHCIEPERPTTKSVLFIHGASFPTRLASGFEFSPGDSWMEFTARQGLLACGLDFLGFGASTRPAAMLEPADRAAPVTQAREAASQSALAVEYLQKKRGMSSIHLVAHSWGTIAAATFAAEHSSQLKSLTLFGPIVALPSRPASASAEGGAWFALTAHERLEQLRFKEVLPAGKSLLDPAIERKWASEFAATSSRVPGDAPQIMRIPRGPSVDIHAAMSGTYPYAAAAVAIPIFVVYGNYDTYIDDPGANAFLAKFTASPLRWRLRIDDGTHVMHLERSRHSLYESVDAFIRTTEAPR